VLVKVGNLIGLLGTYPRKQIVWIFAKVTLLWYGITLKIDADVMKIVIILDQALKTSPTMSTLLEVLRLKLQHQTQRLFKIQKARRLMISELLF